ncbi:MAG TPA: chromate efflux transporter [Hyphomonadaceae bacterium]|nr:chromate efflux transporter [Hyphomonadaceae bacterium]
MPTETPERARVSAFSVFLAFLRLGLTSFGGPIAHLGYFRRDLVERRRWISEHDYADLVALCQFLPGPASSQTGFAIGLRRAGVLGGLAAFLGFTLPSALLMLAAAWGLKQVDPRVLPPVIHGLNLVAVAIVAQAVVQMARGNLKSLASCTLALLSLAFAIYAGAMSAPVIIAAAALAGFLIPPGPQTDPPAPPPRPRFAPSLVIFLIALAPLAILPLLRQVFDTPVLVTADGFYRSGALVFGGGHVVLPLLEAETAGRISHDDFLAGYGAAQALPGPLFSFSAYAGALSSPNPPDLLLGLVALLAIFAPGFLLVSAADPLWQSLRHSARTRRLVAFASASVVGVLAAAWWRPVVETAILNGWDIALASAGFLALLHPRTPVLAVVIPLAALGAAVFAWA